MLRKVVAGALVFAVLAALAWAFWPRPLSVETAVIAARDLEVRVAEEGKSRIREIFTVSAPITGETLRIGFHAGDVVEKDKTVVVSMKPVAPGLLDARLRGVAEAAIASADAGLGLARAEVKQAEAQLAFLQIELSRAERLARQGTISERALEKAKLDRETAAAGLDSARAALTVRERELERARAALIETGAGEAACCTEIRAPASGHILRVLAESEQVVQAGAKLMEIGDPRDLEIVTDVLSRDAVEIKPGAEAVIENWGGAALAARVRRVEPSAVTKVSALGIEEQRVSVILDLVDHAKAAALGDGFRVEVLISVWKGKNVTGVPIAALFRRGGDWAVFVANDGKAEIRIVELGRRNLDYAEVRGGLAPGDSVVLHPSDDLTEGRAIVASAPQP
jgi:HlyD family secretion protein